MYVCDYEVCVWFVGVGWEMAVLFQNTMHTHADTETHIGTWKLVKSACMPMTYLQAHAHLLPIALPS